jgi:hypothetical protein
MQACRGPTISAARAGFQMDGRSRPAADQAAATHLRPDRCPTAEPNGFANSRLQPFRACLNPARLATVLPIGNMTCANARLETMLCWWRTVGIGR